MVHSSEYPCNIIHSRIKSSDLVKEFFVTGLSLYMYYTMFV